MLVFQNKKKIKKKNADKLITVKFVLLLSMFLNHGVYTPKNWSSCSKQRYLYGIVRSDPLNLTVLLKS